MSKKITSDEIQKKSQEFAIANHHNDGIIYFRKLLSYKDHVINEKVRLNLAFMLYHQAFKFYGKENVSTQIKKKTGNQLNEAEDILEEIIRPKNNNIEEKTLLSARIFLAQIYTALKNPKSIILAKENFKQVPNALMANRLADIYDRMGNIRLAGIWYRKFEKLAIKEKWPLYSFSSSIAIFYKNINKESLAQKYLKKALKNLPKTPEGKSRFFILKSHFDI